MTALELPRTARSGPRTTRSPPPAWSEAHAQASWGRSCWPTGVSCSSTSSPSSRGRRSRPSDNRSRTAGSPSAVLAIRRFIQLASCWSRPPTPAHAAMRARPTAAAAQPAELARHRRRLSGPLLDRIDLHVGLHRSAGEDLAAPALTTSREGARAGAGGQGAPGGAAREHRRAAQQPNSVSSLPRPRAGSIETARRSSATRVGAACSSTRGEQRLLRVARTLADLDGEAAGRAREMWPRPWPCAAISSSRAPRDANQRRSG